MNARKLVWLELRNVRPFSVLIAVVLAGYAALYTPLARVLGGFADAPAVLAGVGLLVTFALAWTFAYLFGGFSAVVKRENDVYDRYFALPVAPRRVFLAEVIGVAIPAFLCTAGTLLAVALRTGSLPPWFPVLAVASAGLFVVGTSALVFATALFFDNPRAPTLLFFAGIGLAAGALRAAGGLPVGPAALTGLFAVVLVAVSALGVVLLTRLSARHLHG